MFSIGFLSKEQKEREEYLEIIKEDYEKLQNAEKVSHQHFCKFLIENYSTEKMN